MTSRNSIVQAIRDAGYPAHTDPATVALIEDCLSTDRADGALSREDLAVEVSTALADLTSHPDPTRTLCDLLGHEVPYWVDQPPRRPLSPHLTREAITSTLQRAFPTTRFTLTTGCGSADTQFVLAWSGGPAKASVDDVLVQFLPDPATLGARCRYSCTAIYTCRHQPLPQVG